MYYVKLQKVKKKSCRVFAISEVRDSQVKVKVFTDGEFL